jgi:hypothetical protein
VTFSISDGQIISGNGPVLGPAYAGHPPHVNDPNACEMVGIGPIPPGLYEIGPPIDRPKSVGVYAMALEPCVGTDTYGRSGFYIHGDDAAKSPQSSSDGCIVASRPVREAIWAEAKDTDGLLQVIP